MLPSARVGGPAQQETWVWGRLRDALGHSGEAVGPGWEDRGAPSPWHIAVLRATSSSLGHRRPWTCGGDLLGEGMPLPWAEQLGYPCGRKAGRTQFIRALVKQKSPPPKVRKRKEATVSPEAVLGFSHARGSWIGPNAKQVLSGVTNPTQRCTDQQGPALLLEHTNRSVQHTQHSLKETQTSHGRVGGWAGTRGSGMGWRGHQR